MAEKPVTRPIIFSAPMVRALLDGRKWMTRRLAWRKELEVVEVSSEHLEDYDVRGIDCREIGHSRWLVRYPSPWQMVKPGDLLWVREGWRTESRAYDDLAPSDMDADYPVLYAADADWSLNKTTGRAHPSIHMPRWASRLTLAVTAVKVEKLQDISEEDARAEGTPDEPDEHPPSLVFSVLVWDAIHGKGSWRSNPEVVAITFTVHRQNVDALSPPPASRR